jgi:hypothetical protein
MMMNLLKKLDMTKQDLIFGLSGAMLIASFVQFIS